MSGVLLLGAVLSKRCIELQGVGPELVDREAFFQLTRYVSHVVTTRANPGSFEIGSLLISSMDGVTVTWHAYCDYVV